MYWFEVDKRIPCISLGWSLVALRRRQGRQLVRAAVLQVHILYVMLPTTSSKKGFSRTWCSTIMNRDKTECPILTLGKQGSKQSPRGPNTPSPSYRVKQLTYCGRSALQIGQRVCQVMFSVPSHPPYGLGQYHVSDGCSVMVL